MKKKYQEIIALLRERLEHQEGPLWEPDPLCLAAAKIIEKQQKRIEELEEDIKHLYEEAAGESL